MSTRSIRRAAQQPDADAPPSRDLTGLKGVQVMLYSAPKSDPDVIYIGLNDRDKAWHDLYRLRISTGERTLIRQNTERIAGWIFDLQGKSAPGLARPGQRRPGNPARRCQTVSRRSIRAASLRACDADPFPSGRAARLSSRPTRATM